MSYLEEKAADKNRAELIKRGLPWHVYDSLKDEAQRSYMDKVLKMGLDEFRSDVLPTAPGHVRANFGDESKLRALQSRIERLLPGQRFCLDAREVNEAYRKITDVSEALFGPQISPIDYLKELNPRVDVQTNPVDRTITLTRDDPTGLTKPGRRKVFRESSHDDISALGDDFANQCVHDVFISSGPFSSSEYELLQRLRATSPHRGIRVPDDGPLLASKSLEERGLLATEHHLREKFVTLRLTELGREFVNG